MFQVLHCAALKTHNGLTTAQEEIMCINAQQPEASFLWLSGVRPNECCLVISYRVELNTTVL